MTLQEQIEALMVAIEKNPENPSNWMNLGGIFLAHEMWEPFISLFDQREIMVGSGAELLFQMLFSEIVAKTPQLHMPLAGFQSDSYLSSNQLILQYAAACMKINQGKIGEGRQVFRNIGKALEEYPSFGKGLPHLGGLHWLADQFVTFGEIESYQIANNSIPLQNITWIEAVSAQFSADTPLLLTTCDWKYFQKYRDIFINSLKAEGPIHFHIVNGREAELKNFQTENPDLEISFSIENYDLNGGSPFYASVRFLRIGEIMAHFDRDIAMMDIDVPKVNNFKRLIEKCQAADVTLFTDKAIIPWLRNWATFIFYRNTEATRGYQQTVKNVFLHKLEGAKWFIDQSLLNCVNQYAVKYMPDLAIQFLRPEDGYNLHDYIGADMDLSGKKEIRENADYD